MSLPPQHRPPIRAAAVEPVDLLEALDESERRDRVRAAVDCLSPGRRRVMELRFGLAGGGGLEWAEVGVRLGSSRQAAHQRGMAALAELRAMLG